MHNLVWFRSDLRVYDNPALTAAMSRGSVVAVYLLAQDQWDQHSVSPAKRSLIVNQLKALADDLAELNVPLKVVDCGSFAEFSGVLSEQACTLGVEAVYFNNEYEVNEKQCAAEVTDKLASINVKTFDFHDSCMIQPGKIRTQQGECYKVYSAFKRAFIARHTYEARPILNRPKKQDYIDIITDLAALNEVDVDSKWSELWPAGEDYAHDRLNRFVEHSVRQYDRQRDTPSIEGTSQLSPYLAVGAITTTQCMQAALSLNEGKLDDGQPGVSAWINELIWREFY